MDVRRASSGLQRDGSARTDRYRPAQPKNAGDVCLFWNRHASPTRNIAYRSISVYIHVKEWPSSKSNFGKVFHASFGSEISLHDAETYSICILRPVHL